MAVDVILLVLLDPVEGLPDPPVFDAERTALSAVRKHWPSVSPGGWAPLRVVPGLAQVLHAALGNAFAGRECCYLFEDFTGRVVIGYLIKGQFPQGVPGG